MPQLSRAGHQQARTRRLRGLRWILVGLALVVGGLALFSALGGPLLDLFSEPPAEAPPEAGLGPGQSQVVPIIGAISGLLGALAGLITAIAGLITVLRKKSPAPARAEPTVEHSADS